MSRIRNHRRGANAIEFALTFPVLVAMLFIVMDYGWYFSQQMTVNAAVRDAARIGAATYGDDLSAQADAAAAILEQRLTAAGIRGQVQVDVRRIGETGAESLHVGVAFPYHSLSGVVPTPSQVVASQQMRLEQQNS